MRDRRLLFFGDSFTAGAGDPAALGWAGRVAAACMPVTSYNLGVRGETSVQVAARWRSEAAVRLTDAASFRVVFSVGANDCVDSGIEGKPRVEPAVSTATMDALLDGAAALELPAFVVGPPPLGAERPDARALALTSAFADLCSVRGVPFVPLAAALAAFEPWRAEAAAGDGAHPGAEGYARAADLVLAGGFAAWLRDVG
ncbi:GDSL-type esterase/lipase family protein [Conexibacter woesei]|uniref:Lipolytic protein G-D-S-L family n=1 Tax=Conexibacter woesei (strain DSM 14684 / CCUG 47730 / CIP 108061 / JCM 11494 / NBRC 100937 / ID131577) TaxID=469383 RepID=D3FAV1_CONWI|nr:GDSL-type esterase/lipase family protein [Conexibacter woesei]ADB51264.1 lipolytic protein G-D-S-L family [Conexibacter woesei DSM 14684]